MSRIEAAEFFGDGRDHGLGLGRSEPDVRIVFAMLVPVAVVLVLAHGAELVLGQRFGDFDNFGASLCFFDHPRRPFIQAEAVDEHQVRFCTKRNLPRRPGKVMRSLRREQATHVGILPGHVLREAIQGGE
jgi:hypothetical protein